MNSSLYPTHTRRNSQAVKRGAKTFEPDSSSNQQTATDHSRSVLFSIIGETRQISPKSSSYGFWSPLTFETTISISKGNHLHTMGHTIDGSTTLFLEEAAWLISRNALSVTKQDKNMEFQEFFQHISMSADGWITYEKYQVYVYLKRLGYTVIRSSSFTSLSNPVTELSKASPSLLQRCVHIFLKGKYAIAYAGYYIHSLLSKMCIFTTASPLVWSHKFSSFATVYSSLQIIPSYPWHRPYLKSILNETTIHPQNKLFDWDVYRPNVGWKKRDPGVPDFRVLVQSMDKKVPGYNDFNALFSHMTLDLKYRTHAKHLQIHNTKTPEIALAFLIALVDDSEGVTFLRFTGDGVADVSPLSRNNKRLLGL
ncbi:hypothetical protein BDF14DRAFT_1763786, partial [Spinellus fusiger]